MSLYDISLFLHVVGAFGLVAVLAIESASLNGLRRATSAAAARGWLGFLNVPRRLGGPASGLVVLTGIYMAVVRWRGQAWTSVALAAMVIIAIASAVSARRMGVVARLVGENKPPTTPPSLTVSLRLRWALLIGIAFLMTAKPGAAGAVIAIVVALVAGLVAAVPASRAGRTSEDVLHE